MKVYGLTLGQVKKVLSQLELGEANVKLVPYDGRAMTHVHLRVRAKSSHHPWARKSAGGRWTTSVCWHGMVNLIDLCFDAGAKSIESMWGRWWSKKEFHDGLPELGETNVGSLYHPVRLDSLECRCPSDSKVEV